MTVTPVNDAPVANDQSVTTWQGTAMRFSLDASDPDGDLLTYEVPASIPSGTLTQVEGATYEYVPNATVSGTDSFVYTVEDPSLASASATVTIQVTGNPVTITTNSLPDGRVGKRYRQQLQASGGTTPYTWSVVGGALPPGLTLGADTGRITGVPTADGAYPFDVQVADRSGLTRSKSLSIRVVPARQ